MCIRDRGGTFATHTSPRPSLRRRRRGRGQAGRRGRTGGAACSTLVIIVACCCYIPSRVTTGPKGVSLHVGHDERFC
eukprot:10492289-Alexandrium_andersonii.AAC.1